MTTGRQLRLVIGALIMCLVAASCSGSSELPDVAGSSAGTTTTGRTSTDQNEQSSDLVSETGQTSTDQNEQSSNLSRAVPAEDVTVHCNLKRICPRALSATSWTGYPFSEKVAHSLGGGQVISGSWQDYQLWDTTDPEWGRFVAVDEADLEIDQNGLWHLADTRIIVLRANNLSDNPRDLQFVTVDIAADDPAASISAVGPTRDRDRLRSPQLIAPDKLLIRDSDLDLVEIWPLDGGDMLHSLRQVKQAAASQSGTVYARSVTGELLEWVPGEEPRQVLADGELIDARSSDLLRPFKVTTSGRLLAARRNLASVFDPATGIVTKLTGVEPDDDPTRYRTIAIDELPDGRIVAAYSDGKVAVWNIAEPASPTVEFADPVLDLQSLTVMPDGRLLRSFVWFVDDEEEPPEIFDRVDLVDPPGT